MSWRSGERTFQEDETARAEVLRWGCAQTFRLQGGGEEAGVAVAGGVGVIEELQEVAGAGGSAPVRTSALTQAGSPGKGDGA